MQLAVWQHQQALLRQCRCCWCGEVVSVRAILKQQECVHCKQPISTSSADARASLVSELGNGWARWRYPVYIGILVSTGVSSTIPLLATAVYAASMVLVHMFIVRRPVTWLSAGRRIATRITLKLLLATLTFGSLVISTTLFPFFGVAQAAVAAVSALFAALYVEGALWLMRNRLRREAETDRLDRWEWMLPAGLIGALLACAAATVGAIYGFAHVLLWSEIPGLEQLAEFLLHVKKAS